MKITTLPIAWALLTAGPLSHADDPCDLIEAANNKTGYDGVQMATTGYSFAKDTPKLYAFGKHTCTYLREESVDGQATAVYREQYQSNAGSSDATIWVAKSSGRLLREEQDGDIVGKGKGHISYHWPARK